MKNLMRMEFRRAYKNKWFGISFVIAVLICIWHFVENVVPLREYIYLYRYPLSSFAKWIGGEDASLQPALYYLLVPILIALPYAGTYCDDIQSGYANNIVVRMDSKKYILTKYIVTFSIGAMISVVPLICNFVLTGLVLPSVTPQRGTGLFSITSGMLMADLFYTHPLIYLFLYLFLDAVFFGLLATISLLAVYFTENRYLVILAPFLVYLFVFSLCQILGMQQFCPYGFLRPSQTFITTWYIVFGELALLLAGGGIFVYASTKKEYI